METNTNLETGVVTPQDTPATEPKVEGNQTKASSFDADSFFESLSKRADDFFTNSASKQLEKKYGMSEEDIKALINEHKAKQGNDIETLTKENENLKNEIKNIKKNEVINSVLKDLDVKSDKTNFVLKLADLSDIFNEKGEVDTNKVKNSLENVLNELPEFRNQKEPDFGTYQTGQETKNVKEEDLFNFNFTKIK